MYSIPWSPGRMCYAISAALIDLGLDKRAVLGMTASRIAAEHVAG
jgi:hypothetical protein